MKSVELTYCSVAKSNDACIARLGINRPDSANAFDAGILEDLTDCLQAVEQQRKCRALLLYGKGKHFSAGGDLNWMRQSANLSLKENIVDAEKLTIMYEKLARLKIPSIAVVRGAAFGGAVGLMAACDFAIVQTGTKICLSEVNIGLIPAVIVPYVARKLPYGQMRRLCLSGQTLSAAEAVSYGLAQIEASPEELNTVVRNELNHLLSSSPEAQSRLKSLVDHLHANNFRQSDATCEAIAAIRVTPMAQAGLNSFFRKEPMPWVVELPDNWQWESDV